MKVLIGIGTDADSAELLLLQSLLDRPRPKHVPRLRMLTPSDLQQVLSVRGLRKMYGNNAAVDDVSFEVTSYNDWRIEE